MSPEDVTRHHVWYLDRYYRSKLDKRFRSHQGFVFPMVWVDHMELHANVRPPLKPAAYMMHQCLEILNNTEPDTPLWGVLAVAGYFKTEAPRIFDSLMEQIPYLEAGYVGGQ